MVIGFTGSGRLVRSIQEERLRALLLRLNVAEVHHGDCIHADEACHQVARSLGLRVVLHPPERPDRRAFCKADEERPALPYLERNRVIVVESRGLIALPDGYYEVLRSGHWSTVRYARTMKRPIWIIFPDGKVHHEVSSRRGPGIP